MDQNQINPVGSLQPRKSKLWRFFLGLVGIVVLTLILLVGLGQYKRWAGQRQIQQLAEAMDKAEKDELAREMADTYGGKTPQETLTMYIAAVEKKDYVLASKYFTFGKQQKELDSWKGATPENITKYISLLKRGLTTEGGYSTTKTEYVIEEPILLDFFLYPNGIWKLSEI